MTRKMTLRSKQCEIGLKAKKIGQVMESLLLISHLPKKIQAFHQDASFVF